MQKMKDSGIEWIGEIPKDWKIKKGRYIFIQRTDKGNKKSLQLLSPSQKYGVIPQYLLEQLTTQKTVKLKETTDLNELKTVHQGDFCISLRSFQGGFEYSEYEGVVSPAYQIFYKRQPIVDKYYKYIFKDISFIGKINSYTLSLRDGKNISYFDFGNTYLPLPSIEAQQQIADFLDTQCSEIDATSEDIQKEINILEEYKKSLIYNSVSKGITDKEYSEEYDEVWGMIPKGWRMVDIKYLFEIVKRIAGKEGYDVLSVTQKGLKIKDITSGDGQLADNYSGYQFVYPTDYVMNHMDLLTGWVDCSELFGVTSPDYRVFRLRDKSVNNLAFYKYVMQCCYMNKIFYSLGQGVSNLGRWRLQTSSFNNFKVPVPPKAEQDEIADYLDARCAEIDALIADKKKQLDLLADYKKSLIYEYVTGKKEVPMKS